MEKLMQGVTSWQLIWSAVLLLIALVGTVLLGHARKVYIRKPDNDMRTDAFIKSVLRLARLILWVLVLFAILEVNEVNVTSIVAGVGVAGAVFGFAMQDVFKDLLMGIHIVNDHSFKVGDVIKLEDDEGIVTLFTLQTTQYKSLNTGDLVTVCNRNISKVALSCGIYDIDLGLRYEDSPEHVREVLTHAAERIKALPKVKDAEYLGVQRYESSAVIYKIRFRCDPKTKWVTWRAAMAELQQVITASDLEIPYQQLDVHMGAR